MADLPPPDWDKASGCNAWGYRVGAILGDRVEIWEHGWFDIESNRICEEPFRRFHSLISLDEAAKHANQPGKHSVRNGDSGLWLYYELDDPERRVAQAIAWREQPLEAMKEA